MAREKRVRNPGPFKVRGMVLAYTEQWPKRGIIVSGHHVSVYLNARDLRRMTAWLARAHAWVEDGKKGGG